MPNLLYTGAAPHSAEQLHALRELPGVALHFMQQEADPLPLPADEVDMVVCNGLFLHHPLAEFTRLRFIQLTSAGFDRVAPDVIRERGIRIANARGVYSGPMAEWVLMRVLEHFKQARRFDESQRAHRWEKIRTLREVAGASAAVIGAGNVGSRVGELLRAVGMHVTGFDVHTNPTPGFDSMALTAQLDSLLPDFDAVVLTAPLLPSTVGLMSEARIRAMKPGALLVNVSRGALVDQDALVSLLSGERSDLSAALDVFASEPLAADSPLWDMTNVAVSPHNSFVGDGNVVRLFSLIVANLKNHFTAE